MKPFLMTAEKKERYLKQGYWGRPTLPEVFEKQVDRFGDREFLVDSTKRLSFSQAQKYVDRLALSLLEAGFKKDDVLLVQLPNIVESPLLRLAAPKAGVLAVMVMVAFEAREVKHILKITEARGIVIPGRYKNRDYLKMVREIQADLPSLEQIFIVGEEVPEGTISVPKMMEQPLEEKYSSDYLLGKGITTWEIQELQTTTGSTGLPKISEGFGWYQLQGYTIGERLKATENDIVGFVVPYIGGPGNCLWCVAIAHGCKMVFLEEFDPEAAFQIIEREKISILVGVPTVGEKLVRVPEWQQYDLSSLRVFYTAGAPMPPSLAREIEEKFECKVIGIIGSMDFGPISLPSVDDPAEVRLNSLGKPLAGIEIKIVNDKGEEVPPGQEGELICRGPYAYTGYYKMPEATLEAYGGDKDGWFRTGDLVRLDQDGNLYVAGRLKDIIKRGAMSIAPVEIEDLLRTHPAVADVAVVPMPDPVLGEKVCAFVIVKEGKSITLEEMIAFLRDKGLATFKLPERLEIVDKFPIKGEQKVFKRQLVEAVTKKLKAEGKI